MYTIILNIPISYWFFWMYQVLPTNNIYLIKHQSPFLHRFFSLSFFTFSADADRARKHGMEEFISADPITFDHHQLFAHLQTLSLEWRLKDPFASLVNLTKKLRIKLRLQGLACNSFEMKLQLWFVFFRVGSLQARCLSLMSIVLDMVSEAASDIFDIWKTYWIVARKMLWLTQL